MGLQTAPSTVTPVTLVGNLDKTTWGELGGPFSTPGQEGAGIVNGTAFDDDTFNHPVQKAARWLRSMSDRLVRSDEGLFTTCRVSAGAWNTGGGTLSVTLTNPPDKICIDVAGDGGEILELYAPAISPEVLGALQDSYVDISDAGAVTVVAVANGAPAPALTPGTVRVYKLVTDATELTDADLMPGIAPFPCLGPTIGAATLIANDVQTVTLSASDDADLQADVDVGGVLTVVGTSTLTGLSTHVAGLTVPTGQSVTLQGSAGIAGTDTSRIAGAALDLQNAGGFGAPTSTTISATVAGELFYGTASRIHHSANGFVYATGDQEAATGLSATHNVAETSVAVTGVNAGNVRVIVVGQVQVNSLGSTITVDVQDDQGGYADIGTGHEFVATKITTDTNDWQSFRHERVFAAGTSTATKYRMSSGANGGKTHQLKEVRLRVVNEQA